jgi:hypothetical protein
MSRSKPFLYRVDRRRHASRRVGSACDRLRSKRPATGFCCPSAPPSFCAPISLMQSPCPTRRIRDQKRVFGALLPVGKRLRRSGPQNPASTGSPLLQPSPWSCNTPRRASGASTGRGEQAPPRPPTARGGKGCALRAVPPAPDRDRPMIRGRDQLPSPQGRQLATRSRRFFRLAPPRRGRDQP